MILAPSVDDSNDKALYFVYYDTETSAWDSATLIDFDDTDLFEGTHYKGCYIGYGFPAVDSTNEVGGLAWIDDREEVYYWMVDSTPNTGFLVALDLETGLFRKYIGDLDGRETLTRNRKYGGERV